MFLTLINMGGKFVPNESKVHKPDSIRFNSPHGYWLSVLLSQDLPRHPSVGFFLGSFLDTAIETVKRRNSRLREASKYTLDTISPLKGAGQVGNATPSFGSLRGLRPVGSAVEAMTQGQTPKYHQSLKARNKHSRVSNELDSRGVICRKAGLIPLASGKLVTLRTNMRYLAIGCLVSRSNLRAGIL